MEDQMGGQISDHMKDHNGKSQWGIIIWATTKGIPLLEINMKDQIGDQVWYQMGDYMKDSSTIPFVPLLIPHALDPKSLRLFTHVVR